MKIDENSPAPAGVSDDTRPLTGPEAQQSAHSSNGNATTPHPNDTSCDILDLRDAIADLIERSFDAEWLDSNYDLVEDAEGRETAHVLARFNDGRPIQIRIFVGTEAHEALVTRLHYFFDPVIYSDTFDLCSECQTKLILPEGAPTFESRKKARALREEILSLVEQIAKEEGHSEHPVDVYQDGYAIVASELGTSEIVSQPPEDFQRRLIEVFRQRQLNPDAYRRRLEQARPKIEELRHVRAPQKKRYDASAKLKSKSASEV